MRFTADGKVAVALSVKGLDGANTTGTWSLEGPRLTFVNLTGSCTTPASDKVGVYEIALQPEAVEFHKVSDSCERRLTIDGEKWVRVASP